MEVDALQPWAYITDGVGLFEVRQVIDSRGVMGSRLRKVVLEDVMTGGRCEETLPDVVRRFRLVKAAPAPSAAA